mgnify:CR=1 FL=1|tara:strand:- start:202 stop:2226 length:2025 start_codon:yes stop_codon:yes gene_type:complete
MENHFKIVVPLYNVEKWIKVCIRSVKAQSYKNFECILMDDISTDKTVEIIEEEIRNDSRFRLIKNTEKAYALKNIYDGISLMNPSKEDIIITLDGDDWLSNPKVLSTLNQTYNSTGCWITYGSYAEYPTSVRGKFARQIPTTLIVQKQLRRQPWMSSHLRTFKHKLWNKIKKEDLLDSEGNFYKMTWDLAFMFPMLEMAGEKSEYIKDILYIYNVSNPLNDHKVDNAQQMEFERQIRNKAPYDRQDIDGKIPQELLTPLRFDIAAKTLYGRHREKRVECDWATNVYLEHLHVWNNFNEMKPHKAGSDQFIKDFNTILDSFKQNGFIDSEENRVPLLNNSPLNGAHRVAAGIVHDVPVKIKGATPEGQLNCSAEYFRTKTNFVKEGLEQQYLDAMALEYIRHRPHTRIVTLFPSADISIESAREVLLRYGNVVYEKGVHLNKSGAFNYIFNLYANEPWLGTRINGFPGAVEKQQYCFPNNGRVHVFLVDGGTLPVWREAKERIRDLCKIGNHSIHINDTFAETWKIATSVFNENSIHFLNHSKVLTSNYVNFFSQFTKYVDWIGNSNQQVNLDMEDCCIDASSTLSVYGLREGRDLDFLHHGFMLNLSIPDVNCHNEDAEHYSQTIDEIIYNPAHHFYFSGLKFASLEVVREMKQNRNEVKDQRDVGLINGVLDG